MFSFFKKNVSNAEVKNQPFEIELTASVLAYEIARSDGHVSNDELSVLMEEIERRLSQMEVSLLWLNARQTAVPFYQRLSYNIHGDVFNIPHIGPHYCYYKFLL